MAYGFTDFIPAPQGGYTFKRDDGTELYLAGPDADALAKELDRTRMLGATAEASGGGAGPGPSARPPSVPDAPQGGRPTFGGGDPTLVETSESPTGYINRAAQNSTPGVGSQHQAQTGVAAPATDMRIAARPQQPMTDEQRSAAAAQAVIDAPVPVPGTPGRNPMYELTHGMDVPTGKVYTRTQEGAPYSPEMAEERAAAYRQQEAAAKKTMLNERANNIRQQAMLDDQADRLENERVRRDQIRAKSEKHAQDMLGWVRSTAEEVRANKAPTGSLFERKGAAATIGAAIAVAFGAYGAALSGGPNYALQIINKAIDDDIAQQREKADQANGAHVNALAAYRTAAGDNELAEKMLKESMLQTVDAQRDAFAATAAGAMIQPKYQEMKAAREAQRVLAEQEIFDRAFGTMTEQQQTQWAVYRPATGGGLRPPTLEEMAKRAKNLADIRGEGTKVTESFPAEMYRALDKYSSRKEAVAIYKQRLRTMGEKLGLIFHPESGTFTEPKDWPGTGAHGFLSWMPDLSKATAAQRQAIMDANDAKLRMVTGAAAPTSEQEANAMAFLGKWDRDIAGGMSNEYRAIESRDIEIDAGAIDSVKQEYRRQKAKDAEERNRTNSEGIREY